MFNLQGSEIVVILLLALVFLGPEKLPDAVRRFMQTYNELRKMGQGFQSELKSALDEPMKELRDTANLIKDSADPNKLFAEAEAEQRLEHEVPPIPATDPADNGAPLGDLDPAPGSDLVGTPPPAVPPVLPAGSVVPIKQPDRLDAGEHDGEAASA